MEKFTMRKATKEDMSEIYELQKQAFQEEIQLFGGRNSLPMKLTMEELLWELNTGSIEIVLYDKSVVASVSVASYNNSLFIRKLMVHPEYRRQGLGKSLLHQLENEYPGYRYEVCTSTINTIALSFFKRMGFTEFRKKAVNDVLSLMYLDK